MEQSGTRKFADKGTTFKGSKIHVQDTKALNLPRNIVLLQVFGRCLTFFTLHDQFVPKQIFLLWVEESCCKK